MNLQDTTLVFRLSEDNTISDLKINSEIKHFIADLRTVEKGVVEIAKEKFINFGKSISKTNGSFVIVSEFSFDENLTIVPTLQEAYDFIEMEEIERQLEL